MGEGEPSFGLRHRAVIAGALACAFAACDDGPLVVRGQVVDHAGTPREGVFVLVGPGRKPALDINPVFAPWWAMTGAAGDFEVRVDPSRDPWEWHDRIEAEGWFLAAATPQGIAVAIPQTDARHGAIDVPDIPFPTRSDFGLRSSPVDDGTEVSWAIDDAESVVELVETDESGFVSAIIWRQNAASPVTLAPGLSQNFDASVRVELHPTNAQRGDAWDDLWWRTAAQSFVARRIEPVSHGRTCWVHLPGEAEPTPTPEACPITDGTMATTLPAPSECGDHPCFEWPRAVTVDLGARFMISRIHLHGLKIDDELPIFASTDDVTYRKVARAQPTEFAVVPIEPPQQLRFIRLGDADWNEVTIVQLAEIGVFTAEQYE